MTSKRETKSVVCTQLSEADYLGILVQKLDKIRMLTRLFVLAVCLIQATDGRGAFRKMFPEKYPEMLQNGVDPGQPLFLTPYLESGDIQKAKEMSLTTSPIITKGYSGFLTVNKTINSNMFFWFFPAQTDPANAPVLLWLQGGPGGSSLFGLFVEQGPILVDKDGNLQRRNITWNSKYSMLYIDNPVGTGFSFTGEDSGYATNEEDVGRDLYSCLTQFFQIFNEYQKNDFYITGESYAGKYVPAISYKIHVENPTAKVKINFKGMAIGDGLCDPITMFPKYADFMFNIGVLDESERDYFQSQSDLAVKAMQEQRFGDAFKIMGKVLNNGHDAYFYKVTGLDDLYNFILTEEPASFNYYGPFLARPEVRRAIHVGNLTYNDGSAVEKHLMNDVMQSVKPWIATLMDNYRVLIYNGQLDIIIAVPLTEAWLQTVQWKGLEKYKKAPKLIWKVNPNDTDVAGYVRQVGNFYQVIVRGAGHILPYDQPVRGFDMIQRFIEGR
ncbi:probable serine carboxypeptidase CPVL isoform X2 [Haliotis cracherodii]|uniref:probable serine carboxypeptidase CPVL isoform X2 n=1 Tax=Haliotis cracherodii TaxID=6455 RepID=UPI0039E8BC52